MIVGVGDEGEKLAALAGVNNNTTFEPLGNARWSKLVVNIVESSNDILIRIEWARSGGSTYQKYRRLRMG